LEKGWRGFHEGKNALSALPRGQLLCEHGRKEGKRTLTVTEGERGESVRHHLRSKKRGGRNSPSLETGTYPEVT